MKKTFTVVEGVVGSGIEDSNIYRVVCVDAYGIENAHNKVRLSRINQGYKTRIIMTWRGKGNPELAFSEFKRELFKLTTKSAFHNLTCSIVHKFIHQYIKLARLSLDSPEVLTALI